MTSTLYIGFTALFIDGMDGWMGGCEEERGGTQCRWCQKHDECDDTCCIKAHGDSELRQDMT